jgi:hypothetical protein
VVAPACIDQGPRQLGPNEQPFDYLLAHTRYMESPNWVASCVTELDDTLPHLWMSRRDSVGPPTVYPPRHTLRRRH